ncbi:UNVERIFIED_CONTAM: hypothetical protein K2H54_061969 [Gekko kuhli]
MSAAEDGIAPSTTRGATPTTQVTVSVTTRPLTTVDNGTIPKSMEVPVFYTLPGLQHHDGILYQQSKMYQHLYQQQPLQWGHFNLDSTEEMYILMCGPWRDSRFKPGLCDDNGYPHYGVPGEVTGQSGHPCLHLKTNPLNQDWENRQCQEPPFRIKKTWALT